MAETFLSAIAETVLGKIVDLLVEQVSLAFNVKTDLRKLKATMSRIKAVLLDAERQQHHNERLRLCMWKLREIFYDAEDVIDDFRCEALRKQMVNNPNISLKVRFLSSCSLPFLFSLKKGHKIKEINRRLDELATEWNSFNLVQCTDNRRVIHRETHSFVKYSDVVGRDEDREKIIDLLKKPSEEDGGIPVIPIVGFGGLGKTTLAQLVYNDDRVATLFPLKIWICVSDEFDLPRLLKLIIQSINGGGICDDSTLDALQIRLRSLLNGNKFLLVLDDVWNENRAAWVELRDILGSVDDLSESKIIVTTRSLKVASIMSSIRPYELKGLPHEYCLALFKKWAFDDGDGRQHPNLMKIGEEIVRKCKGVPLAVRTLGSLLFSKTDETEWVAVRDSEMCTLEQGEKDILPVLKLSYNYLPSHLQRCFAFLSLYKKDEWYRSDEVVRLWMANGMLEHPKQKQEWEDVGNRYLDELLSRCLIQKGRVDDNDELVFYFKMHDLIHDLALDVSQKECKIVDCQTETIDENVRHLTFYDVEQLKVLQVLKKLKNVRTIIFREVWRESIDSLVNFCASNFEYLRALELLRSESNFFPPPTHNLKHLPNSISTLKHLQHLHIPISYVEKLPSSFYKLRRLQSFHMDSKLRRLEILNMDGNPLMYMQGLIELRYLEISIGVENLKEIQPRCWTSLQCLKLVSCNELRCLPEGMQYLTKLEVLCISNCRKINLYMAVEDEHLQLSLKTLTLLDLDALRDLPQSLLQGSSSTLQTIRICTCLNFSYLPSWVQDLTFLRRLDIVICPNFLALSEGMDRLTRLEQLNIEGCPLLPIIPYDWHKIAHIPNVRINGTRPKRT